MKRSSDFSARLRDYRNTNGLTLAEMGAKTSVPAQTLNRYELGQRVPKVDTAIELAKALDVNPLWLQGYDVEPTSPEKWINDFLPIEDEKREIISQMKYLHYAMMGDILSCDDIKQNRVHDFIIGEIHGSDNADAPQLPITFREQQIIAAYRANPQHQASIDTLLGLGSMEAAAELAPTAEKKGTG
jgi:transcriptional regulator with XRE-family HTH domain